MLSTQRMAPVAGLIVAMTVLLGGAQWASAKVAVLWLKDRTDPIKGELVAETAKTVTIKIAGIDTPIQRDRIQRIEYELGMAAQYRKDKAELGDEEYDKWYELIYRVYSHGTLQAYNLAEAELEKLVDANPDHRRASLLLDLTRERLAALKAAAQQDGEGGGQTGDGGSAAAAGGRGQGPATLTEAQRNLIKVYEIDPANEPRVVISNDVIDKFLEQYRTDPALSEYVGREGERKFKRLEGYEQLQVMFDARARDFYGDVIVRDEPKPLVELRTKWSPLLIARHCGQCHGGGEIDGPYIFSRRANTEQIAYTNFYILNTIQSGQRHMIDRSLPAESLLLQYALPREAAKFQHPEADNLSAYFNGTDDPRYQQAVAWVKSLLPSNKSYPIRYEVPQTPYKPQTTADPNDTAQDGNGTDADQPAVGE